jgi:hypothetical protein
MAPTEDNKIYHIYLKNECVLHSLSEENFKSSWETLQNLVGLVKTDYQAEDLSYEVVDVLQDISNLSDTSQWLTVDYITGIIIIEMEWF